MVVNNKLSPEYASQPVIFLGHNVDAASTDAPNRINRFYAAAPNSDSLPLMMVDSGQQVFWNINVPDLAAKYRSMINAELSRPPQAAIQATYTRVGDHYQFSVKVTNQSGVALSSTVNRAAVHAIVYEVFTNATRPSNILTNNYVRAAVSTSISQPLDDGATDTYTLQTLDLTGVKWDNLRMVAMVDYRPGGKTGPYDMLQAAYAKSASTTTTYTVTPGRLSFLINSASPKDQTTQIKISSSSASLTWSASVNRSWLSVSPASGGVGTPVTVKVTASALSIGSQPGTVTIQLADAGGFSRTVEVSVSAYLGEIHQLYIPFNRR